MYVRLITMRVDGKESEKGDWRLLMSVGDGECTYVTLGMNVA